MCAFHRRELRPEGLQRSICKKQLKNAGVCFKVSGVMQIGPV